MSNNLNCQSLYNIYYKNLIIVNHLAYQEEVEHFKMK